MIMSIRRQYATAHDQSGELNKISSFRVYVCRGLEYVLYCPGISYHQDILLKYGKFSDPFR